MSLCKHYALTRMKLCNDKIHLLQLTNIDPKILKQYTGSIDTLLSPKESPKITFNHEEHGCEQHQAQAMAADHTPSDQVVEPGEPAENFHPKLCECVCV